MAFSEFNSNLKGKVTVSSYGSNPATSTGNADMDYLYEPIRGSTKRNDVGYQTLDTGVDISNRYMTKDLANLPSYTQSSSGYCITSSGTVYDLSSAFFKKGYAPGTTAQVTLSASGTFDPTLYPATAGGITGGYGKRYILFAIGGGGGGGAGGSSAGNPDTGSGAGGGGGASGYYGFDEFEIVSNVSVVCGTGGTGGVGNTSDADGPDGTAGGTTTVTYGAYVFSVNGGEKGHGGEHNHVRAPSAPNGGVSATAGGSYGGKGGQGGGQVGSGNPTLPNPANGSYGESLLEQYTTWQGTLQIYNASGALGNKGTDHAAEFWDGGWVTFRGGGGGGSGGSGLASGGAGGAGGNGHAGASETGNPGSDGTLGSGGGGGGGSGSGTSTHAGGSGGRGGDGAVRFYY